MNKFYRLTFFTFLSLSAASQAAECIDAEQIDSLMAQHARMFFRRDYNPYPEFDPQTYAKLGETKAGRSAGFQASLGSYFLFRLAKPSGGPFRFLVETVAAGLSGAGIGWVADKNWHETAQADYLRRLSEQAGHTISKSEADEITKIWQARRKGWR